MLKFAKFFFCIVMLFSLNMCSSYSSKIGENEEFLGAISSSDSYSMQSAKTVLLEGGNVVDASVALAFTLAVTNPMSAGLGGGGFVSLYYKGKTYGFDYRESAPKKAYPTFFLDISHHPQKERAYEMIGIPGMVAGFDDLHKRFGKLPWERLLKDAITLAKEGFNPSSELLSSIKEALPKAPQDSDFRHIFEGAKKGELFKQPDLAKFLSQIAKEGKKALYKGKNAREMAKILKENGSLITLKDLENYKPYNRDMVLVPWHGKMVYSVGPPSVGGVNLGQLLLSSTHLETKDKPLNPLEILELREVFSSSFKEVGDPSFIDVPVTDLLSLGTLSSALEKLRERNLQKTLSEQNLQEKAKGTSFSLVDKDGNALAAHLDLSGNFGSRVVVKGTGFVWNRSLSRFSVPNALPHLSQIIAPSPNSLEGGKRPLSFDLPTLVLKDDEIWGVFAPEARFSSSMALFSLLRSLENPNTSLENALHTPLYDKDPNTGYIVAEKNTSLPGIPSKDVVIVPPKFFGSIRSILFAQKMPEVPKNEGGEENSTIIIKK